MKSIKLLAASMVLVLTTSFSTVSFAAEKGEKIKSKKDLPEWYWNAEGRIDPNNPDLENLPPSTVQFYVEDPNQSIVKAIAKGTAQSYLNRDGLEWYGTSATSVDDVVADFSVVGTLYKQAPNSTKLTTIDMEQASKYFTKGVVIAQPEGPGGSVGYTMIAEGIHHVNLGLVTDTVVTTEKQKIQ
ncbi:MAG: hypothetical protein ABGX20_11355 [Bacillus sp. (in: firmicutes)]